MSVVERVVPLTLGWERLPLSYSVHGDRSGTVLVEPVIAVLLECRDGWRLLDTGFNSALMRDPWLHGRLHGRNHDILALLPDGSGEPLLDGLAAAGIGPADLVEVHLSHLHNDHAGGLRLLAPGTPVHVQRRELEYGLGDHPFPERHGMFRIDFDDPELNWVLHEGESELCPGVIALPTPGHTPGHQSFAVCTTSGAGWVFAFDAADLQENLDRGIGPGGFVHCEAQDARRSMLELCEWARREGLPVLPGHDPVRWPAFTAEHGGWAPALPVSA